MTETIQSGDTISVNYTGRFEDGEVFDSSEGKAPLKFTVGSGMLIKGFDKAVTGMKVGESKTVTIPPEDGYGIRNEDHVIDIPRDRFPEDLQLSIGLMLELRDPNGHPFPASVVEITDESVKMDVNHRLAGKTLVFDISIVETGLEPDQPTCGASGCNCGTTCGDGSPCGDGCEC